MLWLAAALESLDITAAHGLAITPGGIGEVGEVGKVDSTAVAPVGIDRSALDSPSTEYEGDKAVAVAEPDDQLLYLAVSIDGAATGLIARFVLRDGRLYASVVDLRALGLAIDATGSTGAGDVRTGNDAASATTQHGRPAPETAAPVRSSTPPDIALDRLRGLRYRFDAAAQTVDLSLPVSLRGLHVVNARESDAPADGANAPAGAATSATRGAVLNYDLYSQSGPASWRAIQTSAFSELRYFSPSGIVSQTGISRFGNAAQRFAGDEHYVRYDTSWVRSYPETLATWLVGDTLSSPSGWSRAIRFGGIQWRRNFALRPDLITYPIPSVRGTSTVPTAVDLYINNVRQFSTRVPTGPFVVNQIPGISGAGVATVVTRDALGRSVSTSVPLYVDTRLLAPGLTSYALEAGFVRRNYGIASFDYDPRPVLMQSSARGITDTLTLNSHGEIMPGQAVLGGGALARFGQAGVLSAAAAVSGGRLHGAQFDLGYQLVGPRLTLNVETIRTIGQYGDIAAIDGDRVASAQDRATLSLPFFKRQSLALSYIGLKQRVPDRQGMAQRTAPTSRIASLNYLVGLGAMGSMSVSLFRDFGDAPGSGIFVSMNLGFGTRRTGNSDAVFNTTASRQRGSDAYSTSAARPVDYAGGFGWAVQQGQAGTIRYAQAQGQYLGNRGQVTATAQSFQGRTGTSFGLTGALVAMDETALPTRRIDDAFALVSTDGTANVPVLHENRLIGTTNRGGYLLVPDLGAYQRNRIGIDPTNLAADMRVETTSLEVIPQSRAGQIARFQISRYRAAVLTLIDETGKRIPPGSEVISLDAIDPMESMPRDTPITMQPATQSTAYSKTIVGYDGQTFVERLRPMNRLRIRFGQRVCDVTFAYRPANDGGLQGIGPLTCRAESAGTATRNGRAGHAGREAARDTQDGLADEIEERPQ